MSRFVAAVLVARGPLVKAAVDPRTPGTEGLGPAQPAALLASAVTAARRQRADAEGVEAVRNAGREAWRVRQQRQKAAP